LIQRLPFTNDSEKLELLLKISENYRSSNLDTLLNYCNQAVDLAEDLNLTNKQGIAIKNKGTILYIMGNIDPAINAYNNALKLFEITENTTEIANISNNKSTIYLQKGNIQEAINAIKYSLKIYNETNNEKQSCTALINLGGIYFRTGDYSLAKEAFADAIAIAEKYNEINRAIEATTNLAVVYNEWGEYLKALDYYYSAINMCNQVNDMRTKSIVYYNIGDIYYGIGNINYAIDYTLKALDIKKQLKLENKIPLILNQLGNIYCDTKKYEMALNYLADALEMAKKFDNKLEIGYALYGMGKVFSDTEIYNKSLDYYNEALKIFEKINSKNEVAETNIKIGNIYAEKLNNIEKAKSFFNIAQRLYTQIELKKGLALVYSSQAKCFYLEKEYLTAIEYLHKSIALTPKNIQAQITNYKLLAESYKMLQDYKHSTQAFQKASLYQDSLFVSSSNIRNIKLEVEYQIQKKEQEFAHIIRQNELNTLLLSKKRNMQYLLLTIIFLLILIMGLGLFFYKKLKTFNANLVEKQKEIEAQKRDLESKNNQLSEANIAANKLSDFKSQFLANISHEIRTPLNAITGYSKLLATNLTKENNSYHINQVLQSTENMMIVINDLLDFSKIEAGKMVLEKIDFSPIKIITNAISTLKFKAEEKNIQLEIHIDPFIPKSLIGDPYRLSQILINLISNALKFSNHGQVVTVEARCENNEDNCSLIFAITDRGVGIPEKKLVNIFETFTQIHSDTARLYEGTGLGLSIVKRLIELQDGQISVKSKVKKGSVFTFSIDYKISVVEQNEEKSTNEDHDEIKIRLNHNILLVEDNLINQELAKDTIASWNEPFQVDVAENGKDAIIAIQEKEYSVILMDIQMPLMDGHEATQYIRNSLPEPKCNIPIIGMTAHAMSSEKEIAMKNGMNEYLTKPFNPNDLKQKIFFFIKEKEK
jgi:signal transduction histidine kinase/CheY-like chemotaxis protein/Tfp pilus assembly protein PilF